MTAKAVAGPARDADGSELRSDWRKRERNPKRFSVTSTRDQTEGRQDGRARGSTSLESSTEPTSSTPSTAGRLAARYSEASNAASFSHVQNASTTASDSLADSR